MKVLNSPAAVSRKKSNVWTEATAKISWEGAQTNGKSEDLQPQQLKLSRIEAENQNGVPTSLLSFTFFLRKKREKMKNRRNIYLFVRLALLFLLMQGVYFQGFAGFEDSFNLADTVAVHDLEGVTIVAQHHREIIPAQRLSGEKLERLNSHSVADAIRFLSGVQIKDFGGIGGLKTVNIRSMGTHHVGVFYNGIRIGNAQNGVVDLGRFSLDNIEEISLYNGQRSRILQPAKDFGTSGTIYLRTRRPRFENNKPYNVRMLFRTGSFDLINPSFLWEQRIRGWDTEQGNNTHNIASSVSAEYIQSSGRYRFRYRRVLPDGTVAWDTTAIRQNGDIQAFRLEGGLTGFTERTQWQAKTYLYSSERGIPGPIVNNVWKNSQRQWDRNFFTQASFSTAVNDRYELLINAKYAHDFLRYQNPDTTLMLIDNSFWQQEIYLSFANRFSILQNWDVSLATDFQWNVLDANLQNFVRPTRYTTLVALATAFEFWNIRAQASLLGAFINEQADWRGLPNILPEQQIRAAEDKREFTPAIFLSYQPFQNMQAGFVRPLQFRAFYKRSFRMPTFNDLYYTQIGNVSLRPEFTTQFNLGFQYAITMGRTPMDAGYASFRHNRIFQGLQISADVYYNEVDDKIVAIPRGSGQFRWMMMNIGRVEIRGLDTRVETNWQLPHDIRLQMAVSYSFQRAQDFSDPTDTDPRAGTWGGQIAYIPWHSGSLSLLASFRSWTFNYSFIYVGERYHNSSNIRENHERPWYTSDISVGKAFQLGSTRWGVSAEINNVFNQQYNVVLNYPMPGTNFRIILRLDI